MKQMKHLLVSLLAASFASSVQAQASCPPPMEPMSTTVRLPDSGVIVVVGEYDGDTRTVVSSYDYTQWSTGQIGVMSSNGCLLYTSPSPRDS